MTTGSIWREFEHDPRDPTYAGLRASERDRDVIRDVLSTAYAEGRLDRDEFDERIASLAAAKTYADLVPPISDLTADAVPARLTSTTGKDVRRSAELYYGEKVREAFFGMLIPNLIVWAIWFMTGHDYFPWPLFVGIPTGLNFLRVASSRRSIVDARVEKLERKQAKALEPPKVKDKSKDKGTPDPVSEPEADEA
jgi:Domain of unknown function (DUF1707)